MADADALLLYCIADIVSDATVAGAVADAIADALTYAVMNTFSDMCNAHCALCIGSDILVTETETISHDKFKQKYMGRMYRTIIFTNFHFTLKKLYNLGV